MNIQNTLERIGKLFGKGRPTLKSLSVDDLKREHIAAESEWNKLIEESEKFVGDDTQLKEEYKTAHAAGKTSLKWIIAQKLQGLELKRKGIETRLALITKKMTFYIGLLEIKENNEYVKKHGLDGFIYQMDIADLERYVLDATVDGRLHLEKLTAALQAVSGGVDALAQASGNQEADDIMAKYDAELLDIPTTETSAVTSAGVNQMHGDLDARADRILDHARKQQTQQSDQQETVQ